MDCKIYIIIALCCIILYLISMQCICCCATNKKCMCGNWMALSLNLLLCIALFVLTGYGIGQLLQSIAGANLTNLISIEHKKAITLITNDECVAYWVIFITALIALIIVFVLIIKYIVFLIEIALVHTKIAICSRLKEENEREDYVIKESSQLIEKLRRHNLPDIFKNSLKDIYEQ